MEIRRDDEHAGAAPRRIPDETIDFLASADVDALAQVVKNVGDAALSLDGNLRALEINPLWVDGDRIEALDVLVVTDGARMGAEP